jgi:hypothetical protein
MHFIKERLLLLHLHYSRVPLLVVYDLVHMWYSHAYLSIRSVMPSQTRYDVMAWMVVLNERHYVSFGQQYAMMHWLTGYGLIKDGYAILVVLPLILMVISSHEKVYWTMLVELVSMLTSYV